MQPWLPWMSGALAFVCMMVMTPIVIRMAVRKNWVSHPQANRWHQNPTALLGGIAIYGAATVAYLVFGTSSFSPLIWLGATVMFVAGLVDDLTEITPASKLVAQIVATSILLSAGYSFGPHWSYWLSIPITFVWVIGITNAFNLLDNMDGLSTGVTAIAAGMLAVFAFFGGSVAPVAAAMAVSGAAAGFLVFNRKPARIFMGDSGSLFLGFMIAALTLVVQAEIAPSGIAITLLTVIILAVPIFDTTLVTLSRTFAGRPISQGGRDHSSHRLVVLGLSEQWAVASLFGIGLAFGALALVSHFIETSLASALLIFLLVALAVFGKYLYSVDVYEHADGGASEDRAPAVLRKLVSIPHRYWGPSWKSLIGIVADVMLISAAFVLAQYLRPGVGLSVSRGVFIMNALPVIIVAKIPLFYMFGLYRSFWRYAGVPEIIRIVLATIAASVMAFAALVLLFDLSMISKGMIVVDWMITLITVAGLRFGFKGLRQFVSSKRRVGKRVLLYGAGDAGLLCLNELRQNPALHLQPLGFLDDDRRKRGQMIQNLRILGSLKDLEAICEKYDVAEVIITWRDLSEDRRTEVISACDKVGVGCQAFSFRLEQLSSGNSSRPSLEDEPGKDVLETEQAGQLIS